MSKQPKPLPLRLKQKERREHRREARSRAEDVMPAIDGVACKLPEGVRAYFWSTLHRLTWRKSERVTPKPTNDKPNFAVEATLRFDEELDEVGATDLEAQAADAWRSLVGQVGIDKARSIFTQGYIIGRIEQEQA